MPIIGNNGRAFLHGLSDFWLRFFKDLGDLESTYEGMSVLLGQTYLNLLSDVLNTSVVETPLFKQEYYKLITIREDQVTLVDRGVPGLEAWSVATEQLYGSLPYLQNKVFAPTAGYEDPIDYAITPYEIRFKADPTEPVLDGFATRDVIIAITGSFTAPSVSNWVTAGVKKGDVLVANRSLGAAHDVSLSLTSDPLGTVRFTVVKVEAGRLLLKAGGTLPETLTGFSWRIERRLTTGNLAVGLPTSSSVWNGVFTATTSLRVQELAVWAVDAEYDDFRLFTVYGHYFGPKRNSSEPYRAFIRGLMQLYVFGPVVDRIESALNVMANLPVIRDDGEVLLSYVNGLDDSGSDGAVSGSIFTTPTGVFTDQDVGGRVEITDAANASNVGVYEILSVNSPTSVILDTPTPFVVEASVVWEYSRTELQTVTTTRETYTYPRRIPMRADVVDPLNWNVLTFRAFDALTTATIVTDYVKDPTWWFNKTLPKTIIERGLASDRVLSPALLPNDIGEQGGFVVGDPGFYIGADEDGVVPANPNQPIYHHRAAFILMDRFLKTHIWSVTLNENVDLSGSLITEMRKVLDDLKPADSTILFTPFTDFFDTILVSESILSARAKMAIDKDYFDQIDNSFRIGSAWRIGDTWKYASTSGGGVLANAGAAVGFIPVVVGGLDPSYQTIEGPAFTFTPIAVLATEPIGYYISRPLHVRTY